VSDATSPIDPTIAARLAELEALVEAQRAALEAERAALEAERTRRTAAEAERDRLREAYEALTREVELARRRLVVAKAERIDTTQLELEFAAKLAALGALAGKIDDEDVGDEPKPERAKDKKKHGRRDLRLFDLPEERIEIPDPLLDGRAARIGTEESIELRWKRGGFVRVVLVRIKYDTSTPARVEVPVDASASPGTGEQAVPAASGAPKADERAVSTTSRASPATDSASPEAAPIAEAGRRGEPACTPEELSALVASDPRTAGATIVTAPMPPRLIERSFATPSLIAHVASDKFCDGLPLHRQEDRFARLGVPIDRATMCRWLEEAGATVGATIVEAMRQEALATAHCIATDATGVLVQPDPRPDKQSQPCRRAHFFVQIADADHVFFEYTPRETSEVVRQLFAGYAGFVQADAKSVFDVLYRPAKERDRVDDDRADHAACSEVGCWSHGRTKFWEAAVATQHVIAREALARIMRMFHLDNSWKNRLPDVRRTLRDRHLRVHVVSFFEFAEDAYEQVKHQRGMLRSALGYCIRQKDALMRFLDDGALEMTNNRSERELRRVAVGRKAWLFVGSDDHGQAAGNLLTLVASARLHKLDPEVYLRDVFRLIPHWPRDRYLELAPRYWRITRARLDRKELDREVGWLTIPVLTLPTMLSSDMLAAPASPAP
jgi:transposase